VKLPNQSINEQNQNLKPRINQNSYYSPQQPQKLTQNQNQNQSQPRISSNVTSDLHFDPSSNSTSVTTSTSSSTTNSPNHLTRTKTDPEDKKQTILLAEQKRRGVMRDGFVELENIVPCQSGKKYSKAQLLNRGFNFIFIIIFNLNFFYFSLTEIINKISL